MSARLCCLMLLPLLPLAACGDDGEDSGSAGAASPCEEETRSPALEVGLTFQGAAATVVVREASDIPALTGDNAWTLELLSGDQPLEGCTLSAEIDMPDHGHGGPAPTFTDLGAGMYSMDLTFIMGGYWEIDAAIACTDASVEDVVELTTCVE